MAVPVETIFALATPPGKSAIAVIRISGPQARHACAVFAVACPKPGQVNVARLRDAEGGMIDQVVVLFSAGPHSSTGEDVVELQCHGSKAVIAAILTQLSVIEGFRPAEPGEFTHRAFHNDKLDLSGAEGLADLIDAETSLQMTQAWNQLDGALRKPVMQWRDSLIRLSGRLEALIDFADEELPTAVEAELRAETEGLVAALQQELDDNRAGEIVRGGVTIALLGPTNAGKSTLLNMLAGREAAIVSDEAGTTRDLVSVSLDMGGVAVTVTDTAGIRDDAGRVEQEGIRRAKQAVADADLTLMVLDGSDPDWHQDYSNLSALIVGQALVLFNKQDRGFVSNTDRVKEASLAISLKSGAGVDALLNHIQTMVVPLNVASRTPLITRARHRNAFQQAVTGLTNGLAQDFHQSPEIAAEEFRVAATALGRITGDIDVEELLGSIFSSFCIGK